MASPVDVTSEGGEGQNEKRIDYIEVLRNKLRQKKLLYVADIILEFDNDTTLEILLSWQKDDILELLTEINKDESNQHKINVLHRNKFADEVVKIGIQQKEDKLKQQVAAAASASSSQVKLLFLGKEEEEAVEAIQSGQKYMEESVKKMQQLFNNLDENTKNAQQDLQKLCDTLKQQIDTKQKEILAQIKSIHQYHLNELNKRNETTQLTAKAVSKFYNDYESYFRDEKLTKSGRKDKLVAAQSNINDQVNRIKEYKDKKYEMNITGRESVLDGFLDQYFSLSNIGIELIAIKSVESDKNAVVKWKAPTISDDIKSAFIDDDNKDNNQISIKYRILYKIMSEIVNKEERKDDDDEWNVIKPLIQSNQYNMYRYAPCQAKVQYVVNETIFSTFSSVVMAEQEPYVAEWSPEWKGDKVALSDNNTKAERGSGNQSVRAIHPISKGMYVKLNYEFGGGSQTLVIVGVISSEFVDKKGLNSTPYHSADLRKYCYGADCYWNNYANKHYYEGKLKDLGWTLGDKTQQQSVTIQMIIDYKTYDTCCLSFYIDGEFKGPKDAKYSMKLPKLTNDHVWYPITNFHNGGRCCKIVCVD